MTVEFGTLNSGDLYVKGRNLLKGYTTTLPNLNSNNGDRYPITDNVLTTFNGFPCKRVSRANPTLTPSVMSVYNTIYGTDFACHKFKGETITVSCYVRASANTACSMYTTFENGTNRKDISGGSFRIGSAWTQISQTLTLDFDMSDNGIARIAPLQMTIPESQRDGSFWIEYSRIKVEFGDKATSYSFAPEDFEFEEKNYVTTATGYQFIAPVDGVRGQENLASNTVTLTLDKAVSKDQLICTFRAKEMMLPSEGHYYCGFEGKVEGSGVEVRIQTDICDCDNHTFDSQGGQFKSGSLHYASQYLGAQYYGFWDIAVTAKTALPAGTVIKIEKMYVVKGNLPAQWISPTELVKSNGGGVLIWLY